MPDQPVAIMMFAAGFGTRMGALTADIPKPLIPVAGRPLIDLTLDLVQDIAPDEIVANLHYKADLLERHLTPHGVTCVVESPDILDTGGGLRHALPALKSDVVYTTNTDAIWRGPNPFKLLQRSWDPERMDALLLCVEPENAIAHTGKGDFELLSDSRLKRGGKSIYGGVQILKTAGLASVAKEVFSLNLIWDQMLDAEKLFGIRYPGKWCDVGHPEGIVLAEALLDRRDV